MTLNVGVVGVGKIGQEHIRRLTETLAGARVVAVSDADAVPAKEVAARLPGATGYATGEELIAAKEVDAVIVDIVGRDARSLCDSQRSGRASPSSARSQWRPPKRIARRSSTRRPRSDDGSSKSASCGASMRNIAP